MSCVGKFIRNHPYICLGTLGFLIVGYLGYRTVRWILHKERPSAQVNQAAQRVLKHVNLEVPPEKIQTGQGEYIAFHIQPDGQRRALSKEVFERVHSVFNRYTPTAIAKQNPQLVRELCANRYTLIREEVKRIDPSLEIAFVPRTLYELIFLRKCIREDMKHDSLCQFLDPNLHVGRLAKAVSDELEAQGYRKNRKCWHLCYFEDVENNNHPETTEVAHRLNNVIVKALQPTAEGFTHQELLTHTEREIAFFRAHLEQDLISKPDSILSCQHPGPTTNFGTENPRGHIRPMGIRNEHDAQIIKNAIRIECSRVAQNSLFIYRGGDLASDSPVSRQNENEPYSSSFGTSLFAGSIYDGSAAAFHFMRNENREAYAIPISFEQLNHSPFYIPDTNAIVQLFANKELFHIRSKTWQGFDPDQLSGTWRSNQKGDINVLRSNFSKAEFVAQFDYYKQQAVRLK